MTDGKIINLTGKSRDDIKRELKHLMQFPIIESTESQDYLKFTNFYHSLDTTDSNQKGAIELLWKKMRDEEEGRTFKSNVAGDILKYVFLMNHMKIKDASLEKSFFIVSEQVKKTNVLKTEKRYYLPTGIDSIRKIWRDFRPVAHIASGLAVAQSNLPNATNPFDNADPFSWLMATIAMQNLAVNTPLPRGAGSHLFNQNEVYWIQADNFPLATSNFTDDPEILKILKNFK